MTGKLGTIHWMSPEMIESKEYSYPADVYSYSVIIFIKIVMWEIFSMRTPYNELNS